MGGGVRAFRRICCVALRCVALPLDMEHELVYSERASGDHETCYDLHDGSRDISWGFLSFFFFFRIGQRRYVRTRLAFLERASERAIHERHSRACGGVLSILGWGMIGI